MLRWGNNSISHDNLQLIYRRKFLDEEITLEQLVFSLVRCVSLASKNRDSNDKIKMVILGRDKTNWQFRERRLGLTMLLRRLLA
jgi:hypothetical protein